MGLLNTISVCPNCGWSEDNSSVKANVKDKIDVLKQNIVDATKDTPYAAESLKEYTPSILDWNLLNEHTNGPKGRMWIILTADLYQIKVNKPVNASKPAERVISELKVPKPRKNKTTPDA